MNADRLRQLEHDQGLIAGVRYARTERQQLERLFYARSGEFLDPCVTTAAEQAAAVEIATKTGIASFDLALRLVRRAPIQYAASEGRTADVAPHPLRISLGDLDTDGGDNAAPVGAIHKLYTRRGQGESWSPVKTGAPGECREFARTLAKEQGPRSRLEFLLRPADAPEPVAGDAGNLLIEQGSGVVRKLKVSDLWPE